MTVPLEQRAARAPADGESERPPWFCGTLVWGRGARGPQCHQHRAEVATREGLGVGAGFFPA